MNETGGPAFPFAGSDGHVYNDPGMTLRDYFAAKAMNDGELAAMTASEAIGIAGLAMDVPDDTLKRLSRHWYRIADAMLKARNA